MTKGREALNRQEQKFRSPPPPCLNPQATGRGHRHYWSAVLALASIVRATG